MMEGQHAFVGNPKTDACEFCDQAAWREIHHAAHKTVNQPIRPYPAGNEVVE